ncbi:NAD-dependent epimerase/dehydratase family protein [Heliophilum fasciatum]|uniref:UDP-glucose 4-epimerase n=1 Tax=Heliophilum fasciatum TaxID=35700 RepID=A0A4R2RJP4_9FIRM|nr:NAD-dependent epimerase/dehydratase family protein [Heliophilum fasciatum]MCW2278833.1 UDP-glucose 4-epimerase [Heliophilum fasciatum]TCP64082.1 UDP-glucose 4-epimerase [Heliophilum fasciatum]
MHVLVTGGAGFIGSHVVDTLIQRGHTVTVLDDLSTGKRQNVHPQARLIIGDVCQTDWQAPLTEQDNPPEAVIHLAAQVDVQTSLRDPGRDAQVNIIGTLQMLEFCRRQGIQRLVLASSAAVYGEPQRLPIDEEHPVAPMNFYGISKHTPEHYLAVYRQLHGIEGIALRFANVFGPRQDATGEGGVVAIFADHLRRHQAPVIFGDGEQTRDFVFVGDVAAAVIQAMEAPASQLRHHIYNVSTGVPLTVNQLYQTMQDIQGSKLPVNYGPARPGDIQHSYLDSTRIYNDLDWRPRITLADGLALTLAASVE